MASYLLPSITTWRSMTELACLPKRPPIYISVPPPLCEVPNCPGFRLVDMVTFFQQEGRLEIYQVCGFHKWVWEGNTPTKFYLLNKTPSLEWIADQLRRELARRMATQQPRPQQMYYNVFYGGTGMYGNVQFRWQ